MRVEGVAGLVGHVLKHSSAIDKEGHERPGFAYLYIHYPAARTRTQKKQQKLIQTDCSCGASVAVAGFRSAWLRISKRRFVVLFRSASSRGVPGLGLDPRRDGLVRRHAGPVSGSVPTEIRKRRVRGLRG